MTTEWWEVEDVHGKHIIVYTEDLKVRKKISIEPFVEYMKKSQKNGQLEVVAIQYKCDPDDEIHWELKKELNLTAQNQYKPNKRGRRKKDA